MQDPDTGQTAPAPVEHDAAEGPRAVPDLGDEVAPVEEELGEVGDALDEGHDEGPDWEALAAEDPRSRAELLAELHEAEARRDEYLDDVRRARAEFENYRKRMLREASQMKAAGTAELAGKLLDVLDDFDRTLEAAQASSDEGVAKGVELVHGKLVGVLQAAGLRRIDQAGVPFDPEQHEAVQQVPAEETTDEPVVHQVLRPGYALDGRVLRAAMVAVAQ